MNAFETKVANAARLFLDRRRRADRQTGPLRHHRLPGGRREQGAAEASHQRAFGGVRPPCLRGERFGFRPGPLPAPHDAHDGNERLSA